MDLLFSNDVELMEGLVLSSNQDLAYPAYPSFPSLSNATSLSGDIA